MLWLQYFYMRSIRARLLKAAFHTFETWSGFQCQHKFMRVLFTRSAILVWNKHVCYCVLRTVYYKTSPLWVSRITAYSAWWIMNPIDKHLIITIYIKVSSKFRIIVYNKTYCRRYGRIVKARCKVVWVQKSERMTTRQFGGWWLLHPEV